MEILLNPTDHDTKCGSMPASKDTKYLAGQMFDWGEAEAKEQAGVLQKLLTNGALTAQRQARQIS